EPVKPHSPKAKQGEESRRENTVKEKNIFFIITPYNSFFIFGVADLSDWTSYAKGGWSSECTRFTRLF
ncbi:MAG: hypothetical protein P9L89_06255, partial [Candidatus Celaenobacter polaris]|nr:hypothetical protein [Candidatus Celaenobacter polaris]